MFRRKWLTFKNFQDPEADCSLVKGLQNTSIYRKETLADNRYSTPKASKRKTYEFLHENHVRCLDEVALTNMTFVSSGTSGSFGGFFSPIPLVRIVMITF